MKFRIKTAKETYHHESDSEVITIGRSRDNDCVIPIDDFSRKHCQLTQKGKYYFIMDLGSKNGVKVDGKKIPTKQQIPIYSYSKVTIANVSELYLQDTPTAIKQSGIIIEIDKD